MFPPIIPPALTHFSRQQHTHSLPSSPQTQGAQATTLRVSPVLPCPSSRHAPRPCPDKLLAQKRTRASACAAPRSAPPSSGKRSIGHTRRVTLAASPACSRKQVGCASSQLGSRWLGPAPASITMQGRAPRFLTSTESAAPHTRGSSGSSLLHATCLGSCSASSGGAAAAASATATSFLSGIAAAGCGALPPPPLLPAFTSAIDAVAAMALSMSRLCLRFMSCM
mmetsp:Transcript_551/g.1203  ORF Transcript_551/g.1203 Transcript_551/m.1203 type:complete len:224 (+) Transcript_551:382-1053(+)